MSCRFVTLNASLVGTRDAKIAYAHNALGEGSKADNCYHTVSPNAFTALILKWIILEYHSVMAGRLLAL